MGSNFMQQFIAGWQMGQGRNENQRRNQELQMEQERQARIAQQQAIENEMRQEHWKLQKQQADLEFKRAQFDAKAQQASMLSRQEQIAPPQTEDLGGGAMLEMGPAVQPRAPMTAQVPGTEGPPVPLPFKEDLEEQALAAQQQKMREALGMLEAQEGIKAQYREKPKSLEDIFAEARARAAGGRAGAPLASASGSMTGEGGKPLLSGEINKFNDFRSGLNTLGRLSKEVGKTGAASKAGAMVPGFITEMTGLGAESKSRQAVLDQAKQVVGKAMEGGVLRKEDEAKYMRILPIISDPPDVASAKLENLKSVMAQDAEIYLETLEAAGRNVTKIRETLTKQLETMPQESGEVVEWTRGPDGRPRRK